MKMKTKALEDENQEQHHRKTTFKEELTAFLKKHNVDCDARFVVG